MNELDELYFKDAFSQSGDNINLTVNNANITCLTSNNNKFSLDSNGNLTVATITATDQANIEVDYAAILNMVYPIGSIYISVNSANPNTLFGGAWEAIEERFLLASGANYTAGTTGGEATHTLTVAEMPSHKHTGSTSNAGAHTHSAKGYWRFASGTSTNAQGMAYTLQPNDPVSNETPILNSANHKHTFTTANTGSGNAHNNMPPYLVVYMWKRIG